MNFMRDSLTNNKKRKFPFSRIKDINFFQTVREGSRNFRSKKTISGITPGKNTGSYITGSSGSSFIGRSVIRPVRKFTSTRDSSFKLPGSSSSSNLGGSAFSKPAPTSISSKPRDGSFFTSLLSSPPSKRTKSSSSQNWNFSDENENTIASLAPCSSNRSHEENIIHDNNPPEPMLFIEKNAEEKCSEFRKMYQQKTLQGKKMQSTSFFKDDTNEGPKTHFERSNEENFIHDNNPPEPMLFIEKNAEEKCSEFRRSQAHEENIIQDNNSSEVMMFIEKNAEEKCTEFREGIQKMMHHRSVTPEDRVRLIESDSSLKFTPKATPSAGVTLMCETDGLLNSPVPQTPRHSPIMRSVPSTPCQVEHIRSPVQPQSPEVSQRLFDRDDAHFISPSGSPSRLEPLRYANEFAMRNSPQTPGLCRPSEMSPFKEVSHDHIPSSSYSNNNHSVQSGIHVPPFHSPLLNAGKRFFPDSGKNGDKLSSGEPFFKIPELPTSGSDQYDTLFTTPRRVKTLPRITTPQLFLPYTKSTPSKPTPSHTKSSEKTPLNSSRESFYVISITEGRGHAVCEVGIAAIDLNHPTLILSQFSDSQTYKKTLSKINIIDPAEMIIPDTFKGFSPSVLYTLVTQTFQEMRVVTVKRQHFSAVHGIDSIRSLLLPDDSSVEMIIHRKYYALAASDALLKYIEIKHGIVIAPKSLKVNYQSAKDVVSMDLETCQRLELVMSNAEMVVPEKYSLFGLLNHTKTLGGRRRLRVCLLQPFCSADVIKELQNSVAALVNDQRSLDALQTNLQKFSNVERLLWLCLKTPNFKNESKTFELLTNYILLLKVSLEAVPHLRKVLQEIDDDHIINIRNELSDNRYDEILAHILKMIQDDARPARGFSESEKQRCFAIRDGVNDLLDVARATYSDLIQMVMDNISELCREYSLPLKMVLTSDLGFHPVYILPKNASFNQQEIPDIFTEVKLKHRTIHLLTEEINTYNMRIKRALQEIQLITNVVIYDLFESLREDANLIYRLCDHISDLDMIACIAQLSSTPDYTKPEFGDETHLIGARHPILDHIRPTKPIPNNVFASSKKYFNVITGPNMGGKTVYVLMVPLIQIMAQIGCFVPADKAVIRITDHIYVKKGSIDSIECGLSSFTKEIKELNYAIESLTDRSLIILDEICSATLSDEGTALAWAYCEEFLKRPVFTFLTTHYHYLTNLAKIYKSVTNYNMEAIERNSSSTNDCGLTFTYRLLPGYNTTTNYGLRLMMSTGLPIEMKKNALEIAEDMLKKRAALLPLVVPETPNTAGFHSKCEKLENFMSNLYGLSMTENFTRNIVCTLQKMALEEFLTGDGDAGTDEDVQENANEESVERDEEKHSNKCEDSENTVNKEESILLKSRDNEQIACSPRHSDVCAEAVEECLVSEATKNVSPSQSHTPGSVKSVSSSFTTCDEWPTSPQGKLVRFSSPHAVSPRVPTSSRLTPFRPKTPVIATKIQSSPIVSNRLTSLPPTVIRGFSPTNNACKSTQAQSL